MIQIRPNLYIGNDQDFLVMDSLIEPITKKDNWAVVHAAKEPYHRQLLGYTSHSAPKDHPEYLIARRGNRLYLNLIDAAVAAYIPKQIIDQALEFINEYLKQSKNVLVHCNLGESRAPSLGLLYMVKNGEIRGNYEEAVNHFKKLYPPYNPNCGMREFLKQELANGTLR